MTQTVIQRSFAIFKKVLPSWAYNPIRSLATAVIGPILFAYRSGYYRSCFKMAAVSKNGEPLPWYTYPSINFLKYRSYKDKIILEFGSGQSTLWWASKAKQVVALEGNKEWYDVIEKEIPSNVELCYVSMENKDSNISDVKKTLKNNQIAKYDVIIIDGLYRKEMVKIALSRLANDGILICDNAEGYGFYDELKNSGLSRIDFFGNAPGVVLPHATSIYFKSSSFIFDAKYPIPVIAKET